MAGQIFAELGRALSGLKYDLLAAEYLAQGAVLRVKECKSAHFIIVYLLRVKTLVPNLPSNARSLIFSLMLRMLFVRSLAHASACQSV